MLFACVCPPSLHTPHPPSWEGGKESRGRGQEKRRNETSGFRHKSVAWSIDTLHGDWWAWTIASFAALLRIFRGAFADFFEKFRRPHRKLQSYTSINVCSLLFQSFTNIGQHVMKGKKWAFAAFREANLLSRPSPNQHFPFAKVRTPPWLKQSEFFSWLTWHSFGILCRRLMLSLLAFHEPTIRKTSLEFWDFPAVSRVWWLKGISIILLRWSFAMKTLIISPYSPLYR